MSGLISSLVLYASVFVLYLYKGRQILKRFKTQIFTLTSPPNHHRTSSSSSMDDLPVEVLPEIFIRLLAKQLAQMRCVCKAWNAVLSDSSFIKSHLHHSIHNSDEILLFFPNIFSFEYNNKPPFTAHPSHSPNLKLTMTDFIKLPLPTNPRSKDRIIGYVIGSVNGLICFRYRLSDDYGLHIWNPSLSVVLTIPPPSLPIMDGGFKDNYLRFGYDPKTDDYKVMKLTNLYSDANNMPPKVEVEVYSMRKGCWKLITQRCPSYPIKLVWNETELCGHGHDGHLHWLGCAGSEWKLPTIVAFDLSEETFREIPLPDSILELEYEVDCNSVVGVMAGKLCVMSSACIDEDEGGGICEVWVMDEYGVAESWVKHDAFSQISGYIFPFGFTLLHGEFLFLGDVEEDRNRFTLYDPVADKSKTFDVTDVISVSKIVTYVDSLVWVAPSSSNSISISQFQEQ